MGSLRATDLADRWTRARCAALRDVLGEPGAGLTEPALFARAWAKDEDAVERRVFDNSLALGRSFRAFTRTDLTLVDLEALLPELGCPCTSEGLRRVPGELASRTRRDPCEGGATTGWCRYWRESLQGLVSGLSTSIRHSRAERCVDVLHVDAESPFRLMPVPLELQPMLDRIARRVSDFLPGARVEFLGLQEGSLCVRTHSPASPCAGGPDIDSLVGDLLRRAAPDLPLRNATPRPVMHPETA